MPLWIVFGFYVGIMVTSESSLERNAAEKSPVRMSQSVSVFVPDHIPECGP